MKEPVRAKESMERYGNIAPTDPSRFLRLAQDALSQSKPNVSMDLIVQARRSPGFLKEHDVKARELENALQGRKLSDNPSQ